MPRAVLFDVDGVLVHGYHARPELQRRWDDRLLEDLGVDPLAFKQKFIFDVFMKKVIIGEMALVNALDVVLPQLGYKGPTQRFIAYWLEKDSQLNHELIAVAKRLKQGGAAIYIATNQEHLRAQYLWQIKGLGEVFADMFYAARLGVTKPNPRFYAEVDRRLGLQSEPPLFFDDSPEVVAAARKAGWEAVEYNALDDCRTHPWVAERLATAFTVRPYQPGDGDVLVFVHRMAILDTSEEFYSREQLESWAVNLTPAFYAPRDDGGVTDVAVSAKHRPIAFCQSLGDEVLGLYVHPEWWGEGIGRALMNRAESRARAAGHVLIKVHASVSSVPFYERLGYRVVERTSHRTRGGLSLPSARLEKPIVTSR